jgi:hypothetical protein
VVVKLHGIPHFVVWLFGGKVFDNRTWVSILEEAAGEATLYATCNGVDKGLKRRRPIGVDAHEVLGR